MRCGHCQQVFDATCSLVSDEPAVAAALAAEAVRGAAPAKPPRLFAATSPGHVPLGAGHRDFTPHAWDMRAPWLDGNVEPELQVTSAGIGAAANRVVAQGEAACGAIGSAARGATANGPAPVIQDAPPGAAIANRASEAASGVAIGDPATNGIAGASAPPTDRVESNRSASSLCATNGAASNGQAMGSGETANHATVNETGPASPDCRAGDSTSADACEPSRPLASTAALHTAPADAPVARPPHPIEPVPVSSAAASAPSAPADAHPGREPHFSAPAAATAEPFAASPEPDNREHFALTRETRTGAMRGSFAHAFGVAAAIALAALLVAQIAWWQRETLMIYWPSTQPLFSAACAQLGCAVTPPRAIDGLRLDASDLRQLDGPQTLELKMPLTNRYRVALAYPSIELTLLDEANNITARRVLAPLDYARPGTPIEAGLPAGTTQTMVVKIETAGVAASNFRVQIFYP
ncbi:hypothetical protein AQ611_03930 [Burkholderia singularis]|nr:hypothetical protein AQ611_03930 [Burkholderia sp. Bp7605]